MCDYRNNRGLAQRITGITAVARWRGPAVASAPRESSMDHPCIPRSALVRRPLGRCGSVLLDHRTQAGGDRGVAVLCCVLIEERSPW